MTSVRGGHFQKYDGVRFPTVEVFDTYFHASTSGRFSWGRSIVFGIGPGGVWGLLNGLNGSNGNGNETEWNLVGRLLGVSDEFFLVDLTADANPRSPTDLIGLPASEDIPQVMSRSLSSGIVSLLWPGAMS